MTSTEGLNADFFRTSFFPLDISKKRPPGGLTAWSDQQLVREPPKIEGSSLFDSSKSRAFFQNNQVALDQDLTELRRSYGFPANDSVATFLASHRAISSVLLAAVPHLKEYFGADSIVNLEVSTDDDGSRTLYGIAVWHDTVTTAAQALENFLENWWLDHMTPSSADLAFTYEIF